jgi:hypothetical protein
MHISLSDAVSCGFSPLPAGCYRKGEVRGRSGVRWPTPPAARIPPLRRGGWRGAAEPGGVAGCWPWASRSAGRRRSIWPASARCAASRTSTGGSRSGGLAPFGTTEADHPTRPLRGHPPRHRGGIPVLDQRGHSTPNRKLCDSLRSVRGDVEQKTNKFWRRWSDHAMLRPMRMRTGPEMNGHARGSGSSGEGPALRAAIGRKKPSAAGARSFRQNEPCAPGDRQGVGGESPLQHRPEAGITMMPSLSNQASVTCASVAPCRWAIR